MTKYFRLLLVSGLILYSISFFPLSDSVSRVGEYKEQDDIELEGTVNYIVDGDTLDINDIRIRLSLVDTPERGQEGFKESKEFVKELCLNKKGEVDIDDGQRRGDRYGREIGLVYCDGINLNKALMENNLATIYTQYCDISEFSKDNWAKSFCDIK